MAASRGISQQLQLKDDEVSDIYWQAVQWSREVTGGGRRAAKGEIALPPVTSVQKQAPLALAHPQGCRLPSQCSQRPALQPAFRAQ